MIMLQMNITTAIDQLTKFKKMSKTLGDCDLVGFDNESITIRVKLDGNTKIEKPSGYRPVLGFAEGSEKTAG